MQIFLDNSALLLGIVISIYTIFTIISKEIKASRARRAMVEDFQVKFDDYIVLITILSKRSKAFLKEYLYSNAPKKDINDNAREDELQGILTRAKNIKGEKKEVDFEKWGEHLNKQQLMKLSSFAKALSLYKTRMVLRLEEYLDAPQRYMVLNRFLECSDWDEDVKNKLEAFLQSVLPNTKLKEDESVYNELNTD